jgi:hypothetical protein
MNRWKTLTYRQRAGVWLLVLFALMQLANLTDYFFITQKEPALEVSRERVVVQLAILGAGAVATAIMLVGLWRRHRWMRWILKAGLIAQMTLSFLVAVSVSLSVGEFPVLIILSGVVRLTALLILSYARALRLYLSVVYDNNTVY